jgi:hypothetical protein
MEILLPAVTIIITTLLVFWLSYGFVNMIVEPIFIMIFKRPIYLYFYPFPKKLSDQQRKIMQSEVQFYRRLSDRKKKYFEHRTADFLKTYAFHGKDGLEITDEINVLVAATFVMLTFGMRKYKTNVFDKIIIYPDAYFSTINQELHHGEFNPLYKAVVFSWRHFKQGFASDSDNLNLGIHEFAHALHYHGMKKRDNSAAIFANMYTKIIKEVKYPANAKRLVESEYFRIYAYTNEFEFIAVILEHFFETPQLFKKEFPELYKNVKQMINYREVH